MYKKIILSFTAIIIIGAIAVFADSKGLLFKGQLGGNTCNSTLMNVQPEKWNPKLLDKSFESSFISNGYKYSTRYKSTWEVTSFDFDNFLNPGTTNGVSIAVPTVLANGVPAPKGAALQETAVKISGYHANWQQWFDDATCTEGGEIKFQNAPVDWYITYQTDKKDARVVKHMIYNIRLSKE